MCQALIQRERTKGGREIISVAKPCIFDVDAFYLCGQNAGATDGLDLLLSLAAEELGLDNHGLLGEEALAEHLEEAGPGAVNHGDLVALGVNGARLLADQSPQAVDVDRRAVVALVGLVVVTHTDLTEITGMAGGGDGQCG